MGDWYRNRLKLLAARELLSTPAYVMSRLDSFRDYCYWTKLPEKTDVKVDRRKWGGIEQAQPTDFDRLADWADLVFDEQKKAYEKGRENLIKSETQPRRPSSLPSRSFPTPDLNIDPQTRRPSSVHFRFSPNPGLNFDHPRTRPNSNRYSDSLQPNQLTREQEMMYAAQRHSVRELERSRNNSNTTSTIFPEALRRPQKRGGTRTPESLGHFPDPIHWGRSSSRFTGTVPPGRRTQTEPNLGGSLYKSVPKSPGLRK
jgi:hypothetical protein